jgi:hypothetical protein
MPALNPVGPPKGRNSYAIYLNDPVTFQIKHLRWWWFAMYYGTAITKIGNATEAARRTGYSPKSARFIACRLKKNPIIRDMLRHIRESVEKSFSLKDGTYYIFDSYSNNYHFFKKRTNIKVKIF